MKFFSNSSPLDFARNEGDFTSVNFDGIRVVKADEVQLCGELINGNGYRIHSACHQGRFVAVKTLQGPRAKQDRTLHVAVFKDLFHPNVVTIVGVSDERSDLHFVLFSGISDQKLESVIAQALRTDLNASVLLAMKAVKGIAAGLSYIESQNIPLHASTTNNHRKWENFDILSGYDNEPILSFDPSNIIQDNIFRIEADGHGVELLNGLCQQLFSGANSTMYIMSIDSNLMVKRNSSRTPRREVWWLDLAASNQSLESIKWSYIGCLDRFLSSSNDSLCRIWAPDGNLHQYCAYLREEITLTSDVSRNAVVCHSSPRQNEPCPMCGQLVKYTYFVNPEEIKPSGYRLVESSALDFNVGDSMDLGISSDLKARSLASSTDLSSSSFQSSMPLKTTSPPSSINLRPLLPPTSLDSTPPHTSISTPLNPPLPPSLNIEDTHEPLPAATPLESSARMFERARDVTISGGQFYNMAGSMNIDASHNKHTSTNSLALAASVTNLWHASNQIVFPVNMGEKLDSQKEGSESDDRFRGASCLCKEAMMHEGEEGERGQNDMMPCSPLGNECPDESDPEIQDIITTPSTFPIDPTIVDEVIHDILSDYPRPTKGNPRSFQRILQALMSSFSPLSPMMTAALLNLDNAQQVKQILLPARPLVFIPDNHEENDRTPIQFIHSSIYNFFLDRTRSGRYFIDVPMAHRELLNGCTSVIEKVFREGQRLDRMTRGWGDAYEYACQNLEAHRRAARTRSKL